MSLKVIFLLSLSLSSTLSTLCFSIVVNNLSDAKQNSMRHSKIFVCSFIKTWRKRKKNSTTKKSTRKNLTMTNKRYEFHMLANDTKCNEQKTSTFKCGNCSIFVVVIGDFFFFLSRVLITTVDKESFNCFFDILFPPFCYLFFVVIEIATHN